MKKAQTVRALIIAVQHYPKLKDASVLDGTLKDAREFTNWLMKFKLVPPANIYVCATSQRGFPKGVKRLKATKDEIKRAIEELVEAGRNRTSELFVFYSGHGYLVQLNQSDEGESVMVPSDFRGAKYSVDKLIRISELYRKLATWVGGDRHFYFVDACRNQLIADRSILGLDLERSLNPHPELNLLCSTIPGSAAVVHSGFGSSVVDGLSANLQAAERLYNGKYVVTVRSLREYIQKQLKRTLDDTALNGDGRIIEVSPQEGTFQVMAPQAGEGDQFRVVLRNTSRRKRKTVRFSGARGVFNAEPGAWTSVQLFRGEQEWPRTEPAPPQAVDFSKPCEIVFTPPRKNVQLGGKPVPIAAEIRLDSPGSERQRYWDTLSQVSESGPRLFAYVPLEGSHDQPEVRIVATDSRLPDFIFAGLHGDAQVSWSPSSKSGLLHRFRFRAEAGSNYVSLAFPFGLTATITTFAARDWITLLIVNRDEKQKLQISQAMIHTAANWPGGALKMAFDIQQDPANKLEPEIYQALGEPVTKLFGYRIWGSSPEGTAASDSPLFPDLVALRRRPGEKVSVPPDPPLLLDNLLSIPNWETTLLFKPGFLDYTSIWTCWRGAVEPPSPPSIGTKILR